MKVIVCTVPDGLIKYNQDNSKVFRKEVKDKILKLMEVNPDIGVNEIRKTIGGSQPLIGTVFMQIKRDIKRKRMVEDERKK